jgi:hypothetical protein
MNMEKEVLCTVFIQLMQLYVELGVKMREKDDPIATTVDNGSISNKALSKKVRKDIAKDEFTAKLGLS